MLSASLKRSERSVVRGVAWQGLAAIFCFLLGLALILNVQLGGEAMWFWYATLFHQGAKLYSDLHAVFQPLFVLETNAWMRVAGARCIPYELLSVFHLMLLCAVLLLVLRESSWPDWQKAVVIFGVFPIIIRFTAYRFDDFHVLADSFYFLGACLVLWLRRTAPRRQTLMLAGTLGVLCGLAVTNRLTDGGVLTMAAFVAVPLVVRQDRLAAMVIFSFGAVLAFFCVIGVTGDTFHAYLTNSVIRASGAKGGTSSILKGPVAALADTARRLIHGPKQPTLMLFLVVGLGFLVHRYWKKDVRLIIAVQLLATLLLACVPVVSGELHFLLLRGLLIDNVSTSVQPLTYVLCFVVFVRAIRSRVGPTPRPTWDPKEAVVLVPVATLLSAALSQANSTSNSTVTMALVFLLLPCFFVQGQESWLRASFLTLLLLAGATGAFYKVMNPYNWGMSQDKPMFVGREVYHHPIYGLMYLDTTALAFNKNICTRIGADDPAQRARLQLFSIPFPYANYFCGVAPWHQHVQMWYDTVSAATVNSAMEELGTDPPGWLLYQRSPATIFAHENEYNHKKAIPHRYLDQLIMNKVTEGQWHIAQVSRFYPGEAWYLIRTQP